MTTTTYLHNIQQVHIHIYIVVGTLHCLREWGGSRQMIYSTLQRLSHDIYLNIILYYIHMTGAGIPTSV